jgi:flavin-dependent dehydrogenase
LIGEGISMALQSAALLAGVLTQQPAAAIDARVARDLHDAYATAWRTEFTSRLRYASAYAHLAMRPVLASPARSMLRRWPGLLTIAAHLAGKDRAARFRTEFLEETS